jgi:hypothetical protein
MTRLCIILILFSFVCLFSLPVSVLAQTVPQSVDYTLPYPGLLPDNPLYKIKVFRDWFVSIMIKDPLKRASFDLLQADKRLAASQDLLQEKNPSETLILETVSKAENYFYASMHQVSVSKQQGADISDIVQTLTKSNAKHLEIVVHMEQKAKGNLLRGLKTQEQRITDITKSLKSMHN